MSVKSKTIGGTIVAFGLLFTVVIFGDMLGTVPTGDGGEQQVTIPDANPDHKAAHRDEHTYTLAAKFSPNDREIIVRWGVDNTISLDTSVYKSPWSETSHVPAGRKINLSVSQLDDDVVGTIECFIYRDGGVVSHSKRKDYGQVRCSTVAI